MNTGADVRILGQLSRGVDATNTTNRLMDEQNRLISQQTDQQRRLTDQQRRLADEQSRLANLQEMQMLENQSRRNLLKFLHDTKTQQSQVANNHAVTGFDFLKFNQNYVTFNNTDFSLLENVEELDLKREVEQNFANEAMALKGKLDQNFILEYNNLASEIESSKVDISRFEFTKNQYENSPDRMQRLSRLRLENSRKSSLKQELLTEESALEGYEIINSSRKLLLTISVVMLISSTVSFVNFILSKSTLLGIIGSCLLLFALLFLITINSAKVKSKKNRKNIREIKKEIGDVSVIINTLELEVQNDTEYLQNLAIQIANISNSISTKTLHFRRNQSVPDGFEIVYYGNGILAAYFTGL